MKVIGFLIGLLFIISIFSIDVSAQEGCCSSHGGVCGCGCCDGTGFSQICDDYYPQCYVNGTYDRTIVNNSDVINNNASDGASEIIDDSCQPRIMSTIYCIDDDLYYDYLKVNCETEKRFKEKCEYGCQDGMCIDNNEFFNEAMIVMAALGLIGGLARGLFGVSKAVQRGEKVVPWYFVVTLIVSAILGALVSFISNMDYKAAAIIGYAGTDILENVASSVVPKKLIWGGK